MTKCRVEFLEAVVNRTDFIAKINLLMPVLWKENYTMEELPLRLADRLKWRGYTCNFPVQIRQERASYVPSEAVAKAVDFEFTVTFSTSIIPTTPQGVLLNWTACQTIISRAPNIMTNCKVEKIVSSYGIADVRVQAKNATVWEVQKKLMIQLNAKNREVCLFNVAEKVYFKDY
ncbi:unnamed protein product [Dicrocoelium dendriticum]|nr:unnamed protein product [Dicrocoelium dendriticum]